MDGSEVALYHSDRRIQDIADYCETDIVNTYRVWLRYELFRGKASEDNFGDCIRAGAVYTFFEHGFFYPRF
jgi:hypothetical protein